MESKPIALKGTDGSTYPSVRALERAINYGRDNILKRLRKNGEFTYHGVTYTYLNTPKEPVKTVKEDKEYKEFLEYKNAQNLPFTIYPIKFTRKENGSKYAVALFSDVHIEERVTPESVQSLNEYNIEIAKQRVTNYFSSLAKCLNVDEVDDLIFACLGDTISGFIHEELSQTNELSPLDAIFQVQSLLVSGLKFLCDNTDLKSIKFIGIVGNHSRVTKKIQHSNGYKMSYEWLLYNNVKEYCKLLNLPIEFILPESEMAIVETPDNKKYIFIHGFQIKSSGTNTVCGIYPALNRLAMKWERVFHQDKIFLGHFHSCISIPSATVNGSVIGYNAFALTNGFSYEEPAQMYELYDSKIGHIITRKIYCK